MAVLLFLLLFLLLLSFRHSVGDSAAFSGEVQPSEPSSKQSEPVHLKESVRIAALDGVPPYFFIEQGVMKGALAEVINRAFATLHQRVDYGELSHARAHEQLRNNRIDAAFSFVDVGGEGVELSHESCVVGLALGNYSKFMRQGFKRGPEQAPLHIGLYSQAGSELLPIRIDGELHSFRNNALLFKTFLSGRLDYVFSDSVTANYFSSLYQVPVVELERLSFATMNLCFSRQYLTKNPGVLKDIRAALTAFKTTEAFRAIEQHYGFDRFPGRLLPLD